MYTFIQLKKEVCRIDLLTYIHSTYFLETQTQYLPNWLRKQLIWNKEFPLARENTGILHSNVL